MSSLKRLTVIGVLFVLSVGTLAHFLYDWSGGNAFAGLFVPVNESVWEHMKLLFFPMLLYALFMISRLKTEIPCLPSALWAGVLAGTFSIPFLYYVYTSICGRDIFLLDLAAFLISVLMAFLTAFKLASSCRAKTFNALAGPLGIVLGCAVCILFLCFLWFSYHPPKAEIFRDPTATLPSPAPRYACYAGNTGTPRFRQRQSRRRGTPPRILSRCRRAASAGSPHPGLP